MDSFKRQLIIATIALLGLGGWTGGARALEIRVTDSNGSPLPNAVVELMGAEKSISVPEQPLIIDQVNKSFLPKVLLAPVNSRVNFPNSDNIRHHVYSFSQAKPFELKLYAGEPKAPILFDRAGIVVLGCNIHDSMVGYIYVADSPAYLTDETGSVQIPLLSDNVKSIAVWHPDAQQGVEHRTIINLSSVNKNTIEVSIPIRTPEPRNTFEDVFGLH